MNDGNAGSSSPQIIPLAGMRKVIARRMRESLHTMAQVTLSTRVDATRMVQLRNELKPRFNLTYTDMLIKALSLPLKEHPYLNAWIVDEEIHLHDTVHIGIAVTVEGGLIVPIVHDVESKSLQEIAWETQHLVAQAREKKLTKEAVSGGTFTLSNLGAYGIDAFTPIVNSPEVAILGVGRILEEPVHGSGGIRWRQALTLSLTFDHRAVDGAPAAAFLQAVSQQIENISFFVE